MRNFRVWEIGEGRGREDFEAFSRYCWFIRLACRKGPKLYPSEPENWVQDIFRGSFIELTNSIFSSLYGTPSLSAGR
jgi:hypothetical protein